MFICMNGEMIYMVRLSDIARDKENKFRVLTEQEISRDARLMIERDTHTKFPMPLFSSRQEMEQRKNELKYNLRMAAGLYPWPEKTPLNVKYEDVGTYEGYCVKKVMFETYPGLWSTGNLYLPKPLTAPAPAILNLIGHWEDQRLTRRTPTAKTTADYPQQLANFARMGFVCLVTDMLGKVDSRQLSHEYGGNKENDLWLSNSLGIHLWNNIRALDLLCNLPEVDASRIGVTGASGGGSQSLFLSLVDERIRAIAPINMISLHMQGGCQCENAPGLRRDTTNPEMCALLAPRPLFLAGSTGDWTKNLLTEELPVMQKAYAHYDAENMVEYFYQDADHQYNEKTRHQVYSFFARHLQGREIVWEEQPIEVEDIQALTWFRGKGHAPGFENDQQFMEFHRKERARQVAGITREERLSMLRWVTGITERVPYTAQCVCTDYKNHQLEKGLLKDGNGVQIPYAKIIPPDWDGCKICVILDNRGKECLEDEQVQKLLDKGVALLSGDLFMTGEFGELTINRENRDVKYYTTFHYTDDIYRVQDVSLLWQYARMLVGDNGISSIQAQSEAAFAVACALPLLDNVSEAVLDKVVLSLKDEVDYIDKFFAPGLLCLGGIEGCLQLTDFGIMLV